MRNITILLILSFLTTVNTYSQGLEDDNMVLYAKANVLFESGRYDEAVRMFNRILSNDENHSGALFMRAKSKYELSAYKGTKNDALLFIEKVGVTKDLIQLMARTELRLSNFTAASNYANTALELDPYDGDMFLLAGDIALESDSRNDACEHFAMAAQLGNGRAARRINEYCNGNMPEKSSTASNDSNDANETNETNRTNSENEQNVPKSEKDDDGVISLEDIVREAEVENEYEAPTSINRNKTQEVIIDDMLTIKLSKGVGHREVTFKPSIFMLSDQDGTVVLDICIDDLGNVTEAIFNRHDSTIFRGSLTSLALRKAKGFKFDTATTGIDCGVMVFYIKS